MNEGQESRKEFLVYAETVNSKFQVFTDNSGAGFSIVLEAVIGGVADKAVNLEE